jgi:2-polyprenyl-3-methyl-5-hydroxy-6-metoxy-1,4-benzoquinol methylase
MTMPDLQTIKARQKAIWESGDFGQVAKTIMPVAEEFIARLPLCPGMRVLDVACGSGNLAVAATRHGCEAKGVDIATNLIVRLDHGPQGAKPKGGSHRGYSGEH